ncbi:helix-turn-helix domain-containing protein [Metaclostridioides mangenotii]|uniref:helix-turn-helix domain-containing protein n=2 Tax=Metaclostridioides mangenotii TaxID=1540 RepID=UPI000466EE48|nr:helix-turn-helix transcriptional regulator [Clostridioides mangenotii]
MSIGENIQNLRKQKGYTQGQLAEKASITRTALGNYERNERIPNIEIANKIAHALDVSVDAIMDYDSSNQQVDNLIQRIDKLLIHPEVIRMSIGKSHEENLQGLFMEEVENYNISHIYDKDEKIKEDLNKHVYIKEITENLESLDLESLKIIDALIVKLKNDK